VDEKIIIRDGKIYAENFSDSLSVSFLNLKVFINTLIALCPEFEEFVQEHRSDV
jgi:hypothetical protein